MIVKHLPHPFRVSSEDLVVLGSIGRSQALADAIRCIARSKELDKTKFKEALLEYELGELRYSG